MLKKIKYLFSVVCVVALAGGFVACSDDETTQDEWTANYVYLERLSLGVSEVDFSCTHYSLDVEGAEAIAMPVVVRIANPAQSDVVVTLKAEGEGGIAAEDVVFANGGKVTIPAGATEAPVEMVTFVSDWAFAAETAADYKLHISIAKIESRSGNLAPSTKQGKLTINVKKSEKIQETVALAGGSTASVIVTDAGTEAPESFPITVKLNRLCDAAIDVYVEATPAGDLPAGVSATLSNNGKITIPAGEASAQGELVLNADWATLTGDLNFGWEVKIDRIDAPAAYVIEETAYPFSVKKLPKLTLSTSWLQPEIKADPNWSGGYNGDSSGYFYTSAVTEFGTWSGSPLFNGDFYDYAFMGTNYLSIKIDLGDVTEFRALGFFNCYAPWYMPSKSKMLLSEDGSTWQMVTPKDGFQMDSQSAVQYLKWESPLKARHIVWHFFGDMPLLSEFLLSTEANEP